eukprot:2392627-Pyramimonas_sp.AAC.1
MVARNAHGSRDTQDAQDIETHWRRKGSPLVLPARAAVEEKGGVRLLRRRDDQTTVHEAPFPETVAHLFVYDQGNTIGDKPLKRSPKPKAT